MIRTTALLGILVVSIALTGCRDKLPENVISLSYEDEQSFLIVCKGYPLEKADNQIVIEESAKRGAVMYARYVASEIFTTSVDPVKDGRVIKFDPDGDGMIVYYLIQKDNLKSYMKETDYKIK